MINLIKEMFLVEQKWYFKKINTFFLISILSIFLITLIGDSLLTSHLFNMNKLFDVEHYLAISTNGYSNNYEYAFFPLLPIIIRLLNIFNIPIIGVIILNNILCLMSAYLIFNILSNVYNKNSSVAFLGSLLWIFSPIRIFTFVPYTESMFIFFSLVAFYLYKTKKYPIILGCSLGLSVMTRSMGSITFFVIFIFLLLDMINNKNKDNFKFILKSYTPATIISLIYPVYLHFKIGSWRYFVDVQKEYWWRIDGNIISALKIDIHMFLNTDDLIAKVIIILTYISLIVFLYLILYALFQDDRKDKFDLIIISILSLIAIFSTHRDNSVSPATVSFFRYFYGLIPIYLLITNKNKSKVLLFINGTMFIIVTFFFLGNRFVA